jgi:cytochrome c oxidase subunit III
MTQLARDHQTARTPERDDASAAEPHHAGPHAGPHAAHPPHLQHHFDTSEQQFEASKFGMWLFLATEFLFFGGLFVLYAVVRGNNPEIFLYGSQFLSTKLGALNTVVLILSSLTMALAVYYAQVNNRRGLVAMLALTLLGGAMFMGVKYVEYAEKFEKNLVWGAAFYDDPHPAPPDTMVAAVDVPAVGGDPAVGQTLWMSTCLACHGRAGEGMHGQAFDMRDSAFVTEKTDQELLAFIKQGRMPFDPLNRTGIQMPPRGGNPLLKDDDLLNIIAYIRTFEPAPPIGNAEATAANETAELEPGAVADAVELDMPLLKSSIPHPPDAPAGLVRFWDDRATLASLERRVVRFDEPPLAKMPDPRHDPDRPARAHVFFNIYFLMTGLHGIHVLVGMGVIGVLLVLSTRGAFGSAYYTPVELTGLYWHVVDIIWIFLFPLFYLIH